MDEDSIQIERLKRKIRRRDVKIAGLEKKIARLQRVALEVHALPRNVERAVQNALCNVRMIPVFGAGRDAKILEVEVRNK